MSSEDISPYIKEETKAVFVETPTNPMMNVTDIEILSKVTKRNNLLLIVDNTFLSPYFQNPIELGADIVIHSGTKFLNGHHDTIAGFAVTADEAIAEKIRFVLKTTGACPGKCILYCRMAEQAGRGKQSDLSGAYQSSGI